MRKAFLLVLFLLALAQLARGQDRPTDADDPARLRAEILSLRKDVKDLRARLAALEQRMATIATTGSDTTKPGLDPDLGFVVPNVPRGSDFGSESPWALATSVHHVTTSGEHDIEKLVAFSRFGFHVPDNLWSPAAKGLKTVAGLPTRDELELGLSALKAAGPGAPLTGVRHANDLAPPGNVSCIQVVDFDVAVDSRTDHYRMTAVKLHGRWFVAHLLALGAEEDARAFLLDLWESQRAYNAYRQGRYAKNLHELAAERGLEKNANIKAAGLTFPFGARLDRLDKDKLEWVSNGNDLRGPFYRFTLTGDEKSGWSALAVPQTRSYATFSVSVSAGADPSKRPKIERRPSTSEGQPDSKRREGEPEGD
jgi:hypothetical protein